jgi:hypothetical protein
MPARLSVAGHIIIAAEKQKTPAGCCLAGVLNARIPHGRLGALELEAPGYLSTLKCIAFGICIKYLTLNRRWKSGITRSRGQDEAHGDLI